MCFRQSSERPNGRYSWMVAGVATATPGLIREETMMVLTPRPGGEMVVTGRNIDPVQHHHSDLLAGTPIGQMVTQRMWFLPAADDVVELFFRRARLPVGEGDGFIFSGIAMSTDPDRYDPRRIACFSGTPGQSFALDGYLGEDVNSAWDIPDMVEGTRGESHGAQLSMPLWGFGETPVGIPGHMHLDLLDAMGRDRLEVFAGVENQAKETDAPLLQFHGLMVPGDDKFRQSMARLYADKGLWPLLDPASVRSAEVINQINEAMHRSVDAALQSELEAPGF
jgi:hypothetical protein